MKRFIPLMICLIAFPAMAQIKIKVKESKEGFQNGSHNALVVTVYEASEKDVEKAWKSQMKDLGGKVSAKKEVFADDCELKDMGENSFDVYAKIKEQKKGEVEVVVAVDLGGAFLNSSEHGSQYKAFEKLLEEFGVRVTKEAIEGQVKEEEKSLSKLEKEQKDLEKDKERLEKSIEDNQKRIEQAKEDIEKAKQDIAQNGKDQENQKASIDNQKKFLEKVRAKLNAVK